MLDSVFSPLLTYSFESDRPEIPVERITVALDGLEETVANRQGQLVEGAVDDLIRRATPLLQSGNVSAIAALESSVGIALQQPIFEAWERAYTLGSAHGLAEMVSAAPELDILFGPLTIRNTPAEQAVLARTIELAGNFSEDAINRLKGDLIASIIPDNETGKPISRRELRSRIRTTLNVADNRAEMIARTESTAAYNTGRINTYNQSDAVEAVRFLAIIDNRTTDICRSRNGMVIPKSDEAAIAEYSPPQHVRCRAVMSPLLPAYNTRHREMVDDPGRSPQNMQLAPLPRGWRTGGPVEVEPSPQQARVGTAEDRFRAFERQHVNSPVEHALLLDNSGAVLLEHSSGRNNELEFTDEQLELFRENRITHNHPIEEFNQQGTSLSPEDIETFVEYEMQEMRAISGDYLYTIRRTDSSISLDEWKERGARLYELIVQENMDEMDAWAARRRQTHPSESVNDRLSIENFRVYHNIQTESAEEFGWEYTRTKINEED